MSNFFLIGQLRDSELLSVVLGPYNNIPTRPAVLTGHSVTHAAKDGRPIIVRQEHGGLASGVLLMDVPDEAADRIAFYQTDGAFVPTPVTVAAGSEAIKATTFFPDGLVPARPWGLDEWRRKEKALSIEMARELMTIYEQLHGEPKSEEGPQNRLATIKARALARIAAKKAIHNKPLIGSGFSARDVKTENMEIPFAGFFSVERHRVRHARFRGGKTPVIDRLVFGMADAVTVLPYDPGRDLVLLIEQFRAGKHARQDPHPWSIEVPAGRIDDTGGAEAAGRREVEEEAAVTIGRMERMGGYYPSPGATSEYITSFIGEADLDKAGGVHGLASENEDIRSIVLPVTKAEAAMQRGEIDNAPALLSLMWLLRNRARLRKSWAGVE